MSKRTQKIIVIVVSSAMVITLLISRVVKEPDPFKILSKYKVRAPEPVPISNTLLEEDMLASITICEISFGYII